MEREIVERAMHGDEEAFDELVGRIGDSLHSVARRWQGVDLDPESGRPP